MVLNNKKKYKGVSVNIFGLPNLDNSKKENTESKKIPKRIYLDSFTADFKENAPKNLILMYDIPDNMKKHRDWFRRQLKSFGFIMVQKSVWVGPSPLPKDFLEYLKEIKIGDKFKTFKLAKAYKF
ncbi:MAG: CRISPR-associated endonuclease Cas2 [Candidatus Nomurabacteria bacterium]|nr:CRISPR-associated endonuclease Cas2 [Candidatus Nomurabacteria bacterium]